MTHTVILHRHNQSHPIKKKKALQHNNVYSMQRYIKQNKKSHWIVLIATWHLTCVLGVCWAATWTPRRWSTAPAPVSWIWSLRPSSVIRHSQSRQADPWKQDRRNRIVTVVLTNEPQQPRSKNRAVVTIKQLSNVEKRKMSLIFCKHIFYLLKKKEIFALGYFIVYFIYSLELYIYITYI